MTRRVVVTGAGVVSALGATPAELHAALVAGRSALRPLGRFEGGALGCTLAGELSFDPQAALGAERNLRPLDRISQITAAAAARALEASGWDAASRARHDVGLVLGTMFCGVHTIAEFDRRGLTRGPSYVSPLEFANTVINAAAGQTAIWHALTGVNSTVSAGASSGLQAVAHAADLIRSGQAEALLAGGVEELSHEAFMGFARAGLLCGTGGDAGGGECPVPFDALRNGFALGEGAALVMLEEAGAARERGARVLAEICGAASTHDVSRGSDPGRASAALARAVRLALSDAGLGPGDIQALSCSANGSRAWDLAESHALADVFGAHAADLPVAALKALLGETLGAAGGFQVVDLVETLRSGVFAGVGGLDTLDPQVRLAPRATSREVHCQRALLTAGGDGADCALVIARA